MFIKYKIKNLLTSALLWLRFSYERWMQPHYGQVEWDELIQWEVQLAMVETVEVLLRDGVLRQVDASLLFLRLESGVMADQPQVGLLESKHLAVLDTVREEVEKRNSVG